MPHTVDRYRIFGEPVDFMNCRAVAEGFRSILRGWDFDECPIAPDEAAYMRFEHRNGIYSWDAPWISERLKDKRGRIDTVADAVCDFHYEFIDWYVDRHPLSFCMHTAAVAFKDGAVLFPAIQRAGKTTLSVHLAKRGHRLIGDDVVAIDVETLQTNALGLLPRIRLPLPCDRTDADYGQFVAKRAGLSDRHWQYVALQDDELCRLGENHAIAAIVLLDRRPSGAAEFAPVSGGMALKTLIDQNFGIVDRPNLVFDRLKALATSRLCLALRYSDVSEAADLLSERFGVAAGPNPEAPR
ncbi:hypothetical protein LXM94_25730 [Rhizobium sp. TRM95111]|uniref:hypothetical protein n=1 Tax=Rhizobium alarense TaxID=2846851 RepID=UPI001F19593A|nr:hypothetical protein [Rhizobium alarense]MCF3643354.1 hypothetical protein [Rhizobium alarense]